MSDIDDNSNSLLIMRMRSELIRSAFTQEVKPSEIEADSDVLSSDETPQEQADTSAEMLQAASHPGLRKFLTRAKNADVPAHIVIAKYKEQMKNKPSDSKLKKGEKYYGK